MGGLHCAPEQPDGRLHQGGADHEEEEAGEGKGETVELEGNHQAEADPDQPAQVGHQGVEARHAAAVADHRDLGQQGEAGVHHHAVEEAGEDQGDHKAGVGTAEEDAEGDKDLRCAEHDQTTLPAKFL